MRFVGLTIFGFVLMEILSYAVHRWLFHGVFWKIHQTHHVTRKGAFEANDIFSIVFSFGSIFLLIFGDSVSFPIGLGVAIYGFVYFIAHDFFTHRRFLPFKSKNKILLTIRVAHQRHHQSVEKIGIEPFGLFLFNYKNFSAKKNQYIER